jgi:phenylalanyl-tRNA synthetase beta chain
LRILLSWLRDLVDVPAETAELGFALHMRGFELAAIAPAPSDASPVDAVINVEITANRPDCLSMVGIAREVATIYRGDLRQAGQLAAQVSSRQAPEGLTVTLEDAARCPRYAAAVADVTIGPSPTWLADRLLAAGVRPINNVVDSTNYVMLEMGQPMHAFDLTRLAGSELRIRTARAGERIRTLDGVERVLAPEMLVIADAERPQAIAGVMGGADSEVSSATRTIALESAFFDPVSVRRTAKRLPLATEASYRFERGADVAAPVDALARVCALLEQIGAGRARPGAIDRYPAPRPSVPLALRRARVGAILGHDVADGEIEDILRRLGFRLHGAEAGWTVRAPSWRVDVSREIDLIEEIARHHGYDRIPTTFPALQTAPPAPSRVVDQTRLARRVMSALGFAEAITFAFTDGAAALPFADADDLVTIANPLSEKFTVMRPSVLPGLVDSLVHNRRREQRDARLYELGSVFTRRAGEGRGLAAVWSGAASPRHWSGVRDVDFFDMKGIVEAICDAFGVAAQFEGTSAGFLVEGRAARVSSAGRMLGLVGQLAPVAAEARGWPGTEPICVAELDFHALGDRAAPREEVRLIPLARFPSIVRDISILVDEALPAGAVRGTIRSVAPAHLLESVREFDRYQGKGVPAGSVSLSLRLTFRAADRTLTDAEVQAAMDAVHAALSERHGAVQR